MGRMSSRFAEFGLVLLVAGCGGGGGGGSSIPEVPFSAFSAVQPNTTVVMSGGMSTTATGTYVGALPNITVQGMNPPVDDFSGANTQKLTYDGNKTLSGMAFSTPSGGASFSRGNSLTFTCNTGVCGGQTNSGLAIVIDGVSAPLGWNYQTFGVWGQIMSATTLQGGAISAGIVTPASALPTTVGTFTFTGLANGFFVETVGGPSGLVYFTTASMTANVDFNAGTVGFSTSGTQQVPITGVAGFARPGLDLSGNLVYDPSVNRFAGQVKTGVGGVSVSGNATGRFYGPSAQEIGGTFNLTGTGGTYIGGFGGRRP